MDAKASRGMPIGLRSSVLVPSTGLAVLQAHVGKAAETPEPAAVAPRGLNPLAETYVPVSGTTCTGSHEVLDPTHEIWEPVLP